MIVYVSYTHLLGGDSKLFAERRGRELREVSIRDYGVVPNIIPQGCSEEYACLRVQPLPNRQAFFAWLEWVGVECLSVEASDLPSLIPDRVICAGLVSNFSVVAPDLSNLRPDELYSRLESAALAIFTARPVEVTNSDSEYVRRQQESATAAMFSRAGVRDPLEAYNRYDAEQAAAAQRRQEQADKDYQEFSPDQPPQPAPTWDDTVRSMTGDW